MANVYAVSITWSMGKDEEWPEDFFVVASTGDEAIREARDWMATIAAVSDLPIVEARAEALRTPRVLGAVGDILRWDVDAEEFRGRSNQKPLSCFKVEIGWEGQEDFEGLWNDRLYVAARSARWANTLARRWMRSSGEREWLGPDPDVEVRERDWAMVIARAGAEIS